MGKRIDRREFLKTTFLGTGLLFAPYSILDFFRLGKARRRLQPRFDGRGSITYDKNCFVINGERCWVTSGSIHYFRIPRALWGDFGGFRGRFRGQTTKLQPLLPHFFFTFGPRFPGLNARFISASSLSMNPPDPHGRPVRVCFRINAIFT